MPGQPQPCVPSCLGKKQHGWDGAGRMGWSWTMGSCRDSLIGNHFVPPGRCYRDALRVLHLKAQRQRARVCLPAAPGWALLAHGESEPGTRALPVGSDSGGAADKKGKANLRAAAWSWSSACPAPTWGCSDGHVLAPCPGCVPAACSPEHQRRRR